MTCDASRVLAALQAKATETQDATILATTVVEALAAEIPQATWVGLYWLRGSELVLGPFVGEPTEHTRIPVGVGVCGKAVADDTDQLIDDVRKVENYLACSPHVRSELVVLVRSRGEVVGQIDMDAREVGAFDADNQCVTRLVADSFGGLIEPVPYDPATEG